MLSVVDSRQPGLFDAAGVETSWPAPAREVIAAYLDRYHHRPHSGLAYRTPAEVAKT